MQEPRAGTMPAWKLSCFTTPVETPAGDLLWHNSYMGAVARIPSTQAARFRACHDNAAIPGSELADELGRELCANGFFVPATENEQQQKIAALNHEREQTRFSLIILPHENCNFRCHYCYEKFARGRLSPAVETALVRLVRNKALEYPAIQVGWFGGEPLLAVDTISRLSHSFMASCQRAGTEYRAAGISTNGFLLTPLTVDLLLGCHITHFQVTLDGPAAIHDRQRPLASGLPTYATILSNLRAMSSRSAEFTVRLRVNFSLANADAIEHWLETELRPLLKGDSRFSLYFHEIGRWGGPHDDACPAIAPADAASTRARLTEAAVAHGIATRRVRESLMPHGNVCYAARSSSIVVGADGALYKCTVAFDDPVNRVGSLQPDGTLQLDQERWRAWTSLSETIAATCEPCRFYPACQARRCPLSNIRRQKPTCPMTRAEYERMVQLIAQPAQVLPGKEVTA